MIMIRKKGNKREGNKFLKYMLSTPIRILKRARQLYMKGVEDCAGGLGYGDVAGYFPFQISQLPPQSFPATSSRASGGIDEQLQRKVQIRNIEKERRLVVHNNGMRKSYGTVGVRKMERIEEDKPCLFEEDQVDVKILTLLYQRSRS